MQKIFLYTLIISLLFATAFAGTNNYRFRRLQDATVEDPILISPAPEDTNSTIPIPADNTTIIVDNTTVPVDNTTIPVDNTTIPVDNSTLPVDNSTLPVDNSTLPVDNSTLPVDNSTLPVDNSTLPVDNSTLPIDNSTIPVIPDNSTEQNTTSFQDLNATQFLKVVGRSSGKVKFGQVLIGFTVETLDSQAGSALQNNSQIVNTTMEQLKSLGLNDSDIQISGIQVLPIYTLSDLNSAVNETSSDESGELQASQGESQQTLQFKVRNSFIVSTNQTDLVGQILDSAMQNGVNYIDYVNYTPLEDDIAALREQLLSDALDHAERLARKVIEKLGYEMGPVMSVNILGDDNSQPVQLLGDESSVQWTDSKHVYQQLVEVQYGMRSSNSSSPAQ